MIEEELYGIIRDMLGDPDVTLTRQSSAYDVPGWDSVRHVSIILATEQHFGIRLLTREIDRLRNVGDLLDIIADRKVRK
jgi:acyl carrier protein